MVTTTSKWITVRPDSLDQHLDVDSESSDEPSAASVKPSAICSGAPEHVADGFLLAAESSPLDSPSTSRCVMARRRLSRGSLLCRWPACSRHLIGFDLPRVKFLGARD